MGLQDGQQTPECSTAPYLLRACWLPQVLVVFPAANACTTRSRGSREDFVSQVWTCFSFKDSAVEWMWLWVKTPAVLQWTPNLSLKNRQNCIQKGTRVLTQSHVKKKCEEDLRRNVVWWLGIAWPMMWSCWLCRSDLKGFKWRHEAEEGKACKKKDLSET